MRQEDKEKGGIIYDLKSFRKEDLNGMSQTEFASKIGVISQDAMSRLERSPGQIPADIVRNIADAFRLPYDELLGPPRATGANRLRVSDTWSYPQDVQQRLLLRYIEEQGITLPEEHRSELLGSLEELIAASFRKPTVVFLGGYASGKTTMINSLLGDSYPLPTSASIATTMVTRIKHVRDRPTWMRDNVYIFRLQPGTGVWDEAVLADGKKYEEQLVARGDMETLRSFSTAEDHSGPAPSDLYAVVFADSDVLLDCDLLDTPAALPLRWTKTGAVSSRRGQVRMPQSICHQSTIFSRRTTR